MATYYVYAQTPNPTPDPGDHGGVKFFLLLLEHSLSGKLCSLPRSCNVCSVAAEAVPTVGNNFCSLCYYFPS